MSAASRSHKLLRAVRRAGWAVAGPNGTCHTVVRCPDCSARLFGLGSSPGRTTETDLRGATRRHAARCPAGTRAVALGAA